MGFLIFIFFVVLFILIIREGKETIKPDNSKNDFKEKYFKENNLNNNDFFDLTIESKTLRKFTFLVVGTNYNNDDGTSRRKIAEKLYSGQKVLLIREPDNTYDENAVKVCTLNNEQIGYLRSEVASWFEQFVDNNKYELEARVDCTYEEDSRIKVYLCVHRKQILKNKMEQNSNVKKKSQTSKKNLEELKELEESISNEEKLCLKNVEAILKKNNKDVKGLMWTRTGNYFDMVVFDVLVRIKLKGNKRYILSRHKPSKIKKEWKEAICMPATKNEKGITRITFNSPDDLFKLESIIIEDFDRNIEGLRAYEAKLAREYKL